MNEGQKEDVLEVILEESSLLIREMEYLLVKRYFSDDCIVLMVRGTGEKVANHWMMRRLGELVFSSVVWPVAKMVIGVKCLFDDFFRWGAVFTLAISMMVGVSQIIHPVGLSMEGEAYFQLFLLLFSLLWIGALGIPSVYRKDDIVNDVVKELRGYLFNRVGTHAGMVEALGKEVRRRVIYLRERQRTLKWVAGLGISFVMFIYSQDKEILSRGLFWPIVTLVLVALYIPVFGYTRVTDRIEKIVDHLFDTYNIHKKQTLTYV